MRRWPRFERALTAVLRLGLGAVFVYAGALKTISPVAFLQDVRSFHLLADPWAAWLAMGLPWLEIVAGAAVITGLLRHGALVLLCGLLVVFMAAILYSWHRGLNISCGCFGHRQGFADYRDLVLRDAVLLLVAAWLLVREWLPAPPARTIA